MPSPSPAPSVLGRRACFSYAAYAQTIIAHLRSSGVPVAAGLTDAEFAALESALGFRFPPDLRAILAAGLPAGPAFPNWRSNSLHHLAALLRLPAAALLRGLAGGPEALVRAPVLVPVYGRCYIAVEPGEAGNPVFVVGAGGVRYAGFDLAGFFAGGGVWAPMWAPAWAAAEPRRVEFWSDMAAVEEGEWWEIKCSGEGSLEGHRRRLRESGWAEEEVAEMFGGVAGGGIAGGGGVGGVGRKHLWDWAGVEWHVRCLSLTLRRAGWSPEDVGYALGGFHDSSFVGPLHCGPG